MFVKGNGEKVHAPTTALSLAQVLDLPYHQWRLSDMAYHHEARTQLLLNKDAPVPQAVRTREIRLKLGSAGLHTLRCLQESEAVLPVRFQKATLGPLVRGHVLTLAAIAVGGQEWPTLLPCGFSCER
jgi:hypothetical protein